MPQISSDPQSHLSAKQFWIYTDGSATSKTVRSGGYAAVVLDEQQNHSLVVGACTETTVNRMELLAINSGIYRIREILGQAVMGIEVVITTDSQMTQRTILGINRRFANLDLWAQFDSLVNGFEKITAIHIERCTEPPQAQADVLCGEARRLIHELAEKVLAHEKFESCEFSETLPLFQRLLGQEEGGSLPLHQRQPSTSGSRCA